MLGLMADNFAARCFNLDGRVLDVEFVVQFMRGVVQEAVILG